MSGIIEDIKLSIASISCKSIEDIFEDSEYNDKSYVYRGHSKNYFRMQPSVFREEKCGLTENKIYSEVLRQHLHSDFENMSDFEIISKMQHYQVPTRLLDLTFSPLVASYFALSSLDKSEILIDKSKSDKPEILCLNINENDPEEPNGIKEFYSPQVIALSALPKLTKRQQDELYIDMLNEVMVQSAIGKSIGSNRDLNKHQRDYLFNFMRFFTLSFMKCDFSSIFNTGDSWSSKLKKFIENDIKPSIEENFSSELKIDNSEISTKVENKKLCINFSFVATADYKAFVKINYDSTQNNTNTDEPIGVRFVFNFNDKDISDLRIISSKDNKFKTVFYKDDDIFKYIEKSHSFYSPICQFKDGRYFSDSVELLHYHITKKDFTFARTLKPFDLLNGVIVKPVINNERVNAQHGLFALYGLFGYWNFEKFVECANYYDNDIQSFMQSVVENVGFNSESSPIPGIDIAKLEDKVFDIERIKFKKSFKDDCKKKYIKNLSKISRIDVKSLGCRMDTILSIIQRIQ